MNRCIEYDTNSYMNDIFNNIEYNIPITNHIKHNSETL